ncbi:MAG: hemolysin family protein [Planctomycetota bacterium]|nr:hemolysin family protein [Planctomycetota bacterium]
MQGAVAVGLLCLSALCSSSETALFSLDEEGRRKAGPRARALLAEPRDLLVTILLINLLVNLAFFTIMPLLFPASGAGEKVVAGLVALVAVLLIGEIFPKTLALRSPVLLARILSVPLTLLVRVISPLRGLITGTLDFLHRLTGEDLKEERRLTPEVLARALENSAKQGVLEAGEADLVAEIVELSSMRVREIMTPRVDMLALDLEGDASGHEAMMAEARRLRLTWLPVVRGDPDTVEGRVEMRDLLANPDAPVERYVMPVTFVPEVAPVLTMLQQLREARVAGAIVVDEWGGTAGVVTLEDLFEELVGELRVENETAEPPMIALGEGRFRVPGGLSVRDWNEQFELEVVPNAFETVGGYVTALLGKLPRNGDRVDLGGGLWGEVLEVRGRRVQSLVMWVEEKS